MAKTTSELKNGNLMLKISGAIDEHFDFGQFKFEEIRALYINFSQAEAINSRGIVIWIRWFHDAISRNKKLSIFFMECPRVLVEQFNLIGSFVPKEAVIKSFELPFTCVACETQSSTMLIEGKDYALSEQSGLYDVYPPSMVCQKCGKPMELDVFPKKYFNFLNRGRVPLA